MKLKSSAILIFFGLFWSGLTLLFDGFVFVPAARQVMASRYPTTEGKITSSQVTYHDDSEGGTTHGVSIHYNYSVAGLEYSGTRYRYGNWNSTDSAWARGIVKARPPDTKVQVYYRPGDPQDSVLAVGLLGSDLFMMAFLTPFNAVMLGFWWYGWTQLRQVWFEPMAGGARIKTRLRQTRVRLTGWSPFGIGLATIALLAFGSIFVVGFFAGGFHPSMRTMTVTWSLILSGGLIASAWHTFKVLSGKYDLIIDELNGMMELPAGHGRKTRRRIALSSVQSLSVEKIQMPSSDGEQPTSRYAATLSVRGTESLIERLRLGDWFDEKRAEQFVQWLRNKLGVSPA